MPTAELLSRLKTAIAAHKLAVRAPPVRRGSGVPFPCEYRGPVIRTDECGTCTGRVELKIFSCGKFGETTIPNCGTCTERSEPWPRAYDHHNLWPGVPGMRFNPALVKWLDGYVLAVRIGWKGSEIYAGKLDEKFRPAGNAVKLNLSHPASNYGREDARLFVHRDRLHVTFAGVEGGAKIRRTNVLYARLTDDLKVERVFYPKIPGRKSWEKNWVFWSHDGEIFAVYTVAPAHKIIHIDGDRVETVSDVPNRLPWAGGERRGGAPPVRVGDEYWLFFHDRTDHRGQLTYRTGLSTFQTKFPFAPVRQIPVPILTASHEDRPADQYAAVVWTAGAVRVGDDWILSNGHHDRWMTLDNFSHAELNARLA